MHDAPQIDREDVSLFLCENCGANMTYDAQPGGHYLRDQSKPQQRICIHIFGADTYETN